jgi:CHAT domain-containing protein
VCSKKTARLPEAFLSAAGAHDLLHMATHADFDATNPFHSRIELRGDQGEDTPFLRLEQILGTKSSPATVILSACTTALADWNRVFNPIALTTGFLARGASRAVGSMWRVDDRSTRHLNQRMYTEVIGKEKDWAQALRLAQLSLLRGETHTSFPAQTERKTRGMFSPKAMSLASVEQRSPYHWAGFQVVRRA